jgi:hypothetical protein
VPKNDRKCTGYSEKGYFTGKKGKGLLSKGG